MEGEERMTGADWLGPTDRFMLGPGLTGTERVIGCEKFGRAEGVPVPGITGTDRVAGRDPVEGIVITEGGRATAVGGRVFTERRGVLTAGGLVMAEGGRVFTEGNGVLTAGGRVIAEGGRVLTDGSGVLTAGGGVLALGGGVLTDPNLVLGEAVGWPLDRLFERLGRDTGGLGRMAGAFCPPPPTWV
jgi:hypothetical protein